MKLDGDSEKVLATVVAAIYAFADKYPDAWVYATGVTEAIRIDPSLDKFDNVVLFPKKLAKTNKDLKKSGFPKLTPKRPSH